MATPMTSTQMIASLKAEGADPQQYLDWGHHNRNHKGPWGPVNGVVIHHTAGVGSGLLAYCYNGSVELPGPVCHAFLSKQSVLSMVGNGRANHAGGFAQNAHDAVVHESDVHPRPDVAEPVDGNQHYYGLEIENRGDGKDPYPNAQYDRAVRFAAAICRFHHWSADSVIGHTEGTRRKVDPSFSMTAFRGDVEERLMHSAAWSPPPPRIPSIPPAPTTRTANVSRLSVARTTPYADIPDSSRVTIYWDAEYIDDLGQHGGGGKTVATNAWVNGTAYLIVDGLQPGEYAGLRPIREAQVGGSISGEPLHTFEGHGGRTYIAIPVACQVGAGQNLQFMFEHSAPHGVTLFWAGLRLSVDSLV